MENVFDTIYTLESMNKYMFADRYRKAIEFAIDYMKRTCEKPSLDAHVYEIRYNRPYRKNWEYYTHVPTRETLGNMKIGDLVELAKSHALENDKFESIYSNCQRRLDSSYVSLIKSMLVYNGYMTQEEAFGRSE